MLDHVQVTGDVALSQAILHGLTTQIVAEAKPDAYSVFTSQKPDAVLVLLKADNLKTYKDPARKQLLDAIGSILQENMHLGGKKVYIGIKGRFAFGAIRVSPDVEKLGSIVQESPLYDFYGEKKVPVAEDQVGAIR